MGIISRLKNVIRANTSSKPQPKVNLFTLQPGDIVNIEGTDYEIEGAMHMNASGWKWIEYKMKEGRSTYWMSVEQDDELEITLCKEVVTGMRETPRSFTYEGVEYFLDESSHASVEKTAGNAAVPVGKVVEYWDYYDKDEEHAFFIERWEGEFETSVGKYIEDYNVEIFPISDR